MRIISGIARGKKLFSPLTETTQPTMDRAKETLFNMLESWRLQEGLGWGQISFLDAFAGSGSVGLEAWSRGVKSLYFMENDVSALQILNQNRALFHLPPVEKSDALHPMPVHRAMRVVFMDAPYGKGLWAQALLALTQQGWIDSETLVVVETDKKSPEPVPDTFEVLKERAAGRNLFLFLKTRS